MSLETSTHAGNRAAFHISALQDGAARQPGLLLVSLDGIITGTNAAAADFFRLNAGQVLALKLESFSPGLRELMERAGGARESVSSRVDVFLPCGETVAATARVSRLQSADSGSAWLVALEDAAATPPDIRLLQLERLAKLGTMAASTAHEIKNSLVASKTFIDLLLEKNPCADLAAEAERELRRTDMLLAQILRFAGPGHGTPEAVSVHAVLEHAIRLVQHQFTVGGIVVEQDLLAGSEIVRAGQHQLEQVFVNLLLNALDATGPGGSLRISTDNRDPGWQKATGRAFTPGQHIFVTVQDSGMGMSPEIVRHLFEPFFSTKENGTGLGLAIARRIITEYGGTIDVQTKPGQGTTFTIMLPLTEASGTGI